MMLEPVHPTKPVVPYIGGKRILSRRLVEIIAAEPHGLYAEPFVGMGGVFFRRRSRPEVEVINDISTDIVNVFRILQRHYQQLLDVLKWQICSRAEFERLVAADPDLLTDLERAARWIYLQRAGFGGKVVGQAFGVDKFTGARFNLTKVVPMLEDVHERLVGVCIERLPYADLIRRYDRPDALFYIDPPYFGCENSYGAGVFSKSDYEALRAILSGIQGRFIMSINDVPEMREIFSEFDVEEARLSYQISRRPTPAKELILRG